MDEFRTLGATRQSIGLLLRNPGAFLKMSLAWVLIDIAILLGYCVYAWHANGGAFDVARSLHALDQTENLRLQILLTVIPNMLASLSVAILWTRFAVAGQRPPLWLQVPAGSARYFSRSLILIFGAIIAMIPGVVLARLLVVDSLTMPEAWRNAAMGALIGVDVLVVLYAVGRFWLVFPAIAMGEPLGFGQSFRLTRRAWFPLLAASVLCELAFAVPSIAIAAAQDYLPASGAIADAGALAIEFLSSLLALAADAAVADVAALAYRVLMPSQS